MRSSLDFSAYFRLLAANDSILSLGTVTQMAGLLIESNGPAAAVGDFCEIQTSGAACACR